MNICRDLTEAADALAERHRRTALHLAVRPAPYPYPREGETVREFAERARVDETTLFDQLQRSPS